MKNQKMVVAAGAASMLAALAFGQVPGFLCAD